MDMTASVIKNDVNYQAVIEAIALLKSHEVCIGIPENSKARKDEEDTPVTNAELLFIHTKGSPKHNIPPRPVLEPAITHNQDDVAAELKKAVDAAVNGDKKAILPALKAAGQYGEEIARKWFTNPDNGWAPNSDITINGSKIREKEKEVEYTRKYKTKDGYKLVTKTKIVIEKKQFIKGKGSDRPLIDTGEMRKSITYVVREVEH